MNKIILMGRLTADPEVRYSQGEKPLAVARYTLAVERRQKREDGASADFFRVVAFGRLAEFAEKYLQKGMKIVLSGHVQTGTYFNKDGVKMPSFDVVAEEQMFAERKQAGPASLNGYPAYDSPAQAGKVGGVPTDPDGFIAVPDEEDGLPFD